MTKRGKSASQTRLTEGKRARLFASAATFAVFFLLWSGISASGLVAPVFLPGPWAVLTETYAMLVSGSLLSDIGASLFRVLVGFGLSVLVAVPLGVLMGVFDWLKAFLSPFAAFIRYMPVAAFIPLLILWLGIGHVEKIALLFIGVFFYLLAMVTATVRSVPTELVETAYTLGASKWQVILRVVVPASLPGIFESMRVLIGAAWTYIVVAELVAAESGLGKMIIEAQRFLQTARVISGILTIGLIGLTFDAVFRLVRARLFPWLGKANHLA